jgi:hypothetical protein
MSEQIKKLIAEREERMAQERHRIQLLVEKLPDYWAALKASIQNDCEDSRGVLHFRVSSENELRVLSEWEWLELIVSFNQEAGAILARCLTNHRTGPETLFWERAFHGLYDYGSISMAPSAQQDPESVVSHFPSSLSEELLVGLLSTGESLSSRASPVKT